jgi:peptidoglycan glycosyltransferase/penicillin-binding protein 2
MPPGEDSEEERLVRGRLNYLTRVFGLAFLFLLGLFFRYQVIGPLDRERFVRPAFSQRQKGVPVKLARANILDRYGVPLHCPVWEPALAVFPGEPRDPGEIEQAIASILGLQSYDGPRLPAPGDPPVKVARCLSPSQVARAVELARPDCLAIVPEEVRYGPGSLACHVVGHVRQNAYLDPRDNVGESGLERSFQSCLFGGEPAWAGVVVTGEGGDVPGTGIRIAPGDRVPADLYTTIDASVQRSVESALDRLEVKKGAAVVLDARTAEILAMASRPAFDQNRPAESLSRADAPFVNRAISAFTPGSVFKPVVMSFALEQGYVSPDETFTCQGQVSVGARTVSCGVDKDGHGRVDPQQALAKSCNSTLIQIGLRIDPAALVDYARKCGFGVRTGIPLGDEAGGVLPDPYAMYSGDVANLSIGQGYVAVTPLQVAAFFRAIAAGGTYLRPTLIPGDQKGTPVRLFSEETARQLQDALLLATREGTGKEAWVPRYGSAGKTGTAETGYPSRLTHAWFCGWTPILAPEYVIAVLVEEGGDGPSVAGPVFREIAASIQP